MSSQKIYELNFDAVQVSQIGLIIICLWILFLLKRNLKKNRYGFLLVSLFLFSLIYSYLLKFTSFQIPNLFIFFVFLAGPTLFFHIKEYQIVGNTSKHHYIKHLYLSVSIGLLSLFNLFENFKLILTVFAIIHFGYYLINSINVLSRKKVIAVRETKASINVIKRRWTRDFYLLTAILFVYITVIIESLFTEIKMQYRFTFIVMFLCTITLFIWLIVIRINEMYRFYKNNFITKSNKYKNSILTKEDSLKLSEKLQNIMYEQKLYLDNEINLNSISSKLKVHPKALSQAINENLNGNFFDYINSLRIEDSKKMLSDSFYKEYKIYEIMYEVGFNSRSSFNTAFKKYTGITASQFREKNNNY